MEFIIGMVVGGIITGLAMILNTHFNAKIAREKEEREYKRIYADRDMSELENMYVEALHSLDKLIRGQGRASEDELEKFYMLEIKLRIKSNTTIIKGFQELRSEIVNMAQNIPPLPEEFIQTFEPDDERKARLARTKKAKQKRDEEAKKYTGNLYRMHKELLGHMENHLVEKKSLAFEQTKTTKT